MNKEAPQGNTALSSFLCGQPPLADTRLTMFMLLFTLVTSRVITRNTAGQLLFFFGLWSVWILVVWLTCKRSQKPPRRHLFESAPIFSLRQSTFPLLQNFDHLSAEDQTALLAIVKNASAFLKEADTPLKFYELRARSTVYLAVLRVIQTTLQEERWNPEAPLYAEAAAFFTTYSEWKRLRNSWESVPFSLDQSIAHLKTIRTQTRART